MITLSIQTQERPVSLPNPYLTPKPPFLPSPPSQTFSRRSQTPKATSCATPFTRHVHSRQVQRDRRQVSGCQELGTERNGEGLLMCVGFPFGVMNSSGNRQWLCNTVQVAVPRNCTL